MPFRIIGAEKNKEKNIKSTGKYKGGTLMKKLAAIFTAAVMVITIGACVNGQAAGNASGEPAAVTREV